MSTLRNQIFYRVRSPGHSYYSDFGKERSRVKGSLPSPGPRKFLKGIASWLHWLLGRRAFVALKETWKTVIHSEEKVNEHMI